jgi:hypothetical protein
MKMKTKLPYALKKAALLAMIGALPVLSACAKDDAKEDNPKEELKAPDEDNSKEDDPKEEPQTPPKDSTAEKIAELTALEKVQAQEVRDAIEPAKTQPRNVSAGFDNNFVAVVQELNKGWPQNLADSAEVLVKVVDKREAIAKNDSMEMSNEVTMKALRTKSSIYLNIIQELKELLK